MRHDRCIFRAVPSWLFSPAQWLIVLLSIALPGSALAKGPKERPQSIRLIEFAKIASNAVAACKGDTTLLPLNSAEFSFKVETEKSGTAGLEVWIISADATQSRGAASEVTFSYQVPEPAKELALEAFSFPNPQVLQQKLVDLIKASAHSAKAVPDVAGVPFNNLSVSVAFQVKNEASAGAKIPIWSLVFGPKITASQTNTHSIKLEFKKSDGPSGAPPSTAGSPPPVASPSPTPLP